MTTRLVSVDGFFIDTDIGQRFRLHGDATVSLETFRWLMGSIARSFPPRSVTIGECCGTLPGNVVSSQVPEVTVKFYTGNLSSKTFLVPAKFCPGCGREFKITPEDPRR